MVKYAEPMQRWQPGAIRRSRALPTQRLANIMAITRGISYMSSHNQQDTDLIPAA
jgi:hypothetical protein